MINYRNRLTWEYEEAFVKYMCRQLNVPLYIRRINEIQRTCDENREEYEKYTHDVRFNCYKMFENHLVILGHNYDDCLENIFSNIKKMKHMNYLKGMKPFSIIEDVPIYRPLLDIKKCNILGYAQLHYIPYLEDSTPKWSERGRMRDNLIPSINEYSSDICKNMDLVGEQLSLLYDIYDNNISKLKINKLDEYLEVEMDKYRNRYYMSQLFIYLSKNWDVMIPSQKVILQLLNSKVGVKVTYGKDKYIKLENNKLIIYMCVI